MAYPTLVLSRGGTSIELSRANGFDVLPGLEGFATPPVSLSETDPADFDGSIVTNVRYEPREIFIPLLLQDDNQGVARQKRRELARLLNAKAGLTTLTVTHEASTSGELLSADAVDGVATSYAGIVGDVTTENVVVRTGSNSLYFDDAGVPSNEAGLDSSERVTVVPGAAYKASAWFRNSSGTASSRVALEFFDDSGSTITVPYWSAEVAGSSSAWTNVQVEASAPADSVTVGLRILGADYWDDMSIVELPMVREIEGRLSESDGGALSATESDRWHRIGLTLRCPDPMWLGPQDGSSVLNYVGGGFYDTFTTEISVNLSGDAEVWPTIVIGATAGGVGTVVQFYEDGGSTVTAQFQIDDVATDTITIETDPRQLSVTKSDGSSAWSWVSGYGGDEPSFFAIPTGTHDVKTFKPSTPVVTGASTSLSWRSRWLTAW